jgi:excisionase family DNA binding protein
MTRGKMDPQDLLNDPLLTIEESSKLVKLTPWTIRGLIAKGVLKGVKVRDRRLIRLSELRTLVRD